MTLVLSKKGKSFHKNYDESYNSSCLIISTRKEKTIHNNRKIFNKSTSKQEEEQNKRTKMNSIRNNKFNNNNNKNINSYNSSTITVILTSILTTILIINIVFINNVALAQQLVSSSSNHHYNLQSSQALSSPLLHNNNNNNQYQSGLFKDLSGPTSGKIQTLDVICGKNFMTVRAEFSAPFYGIVFSKGTYGQENCIYVKPNSGLTSTAFNVYYDKCGTKPDLQKKFYENTIVIQYGSDIIEAYDEAKRLRCEWFEAYEKPATFKPAIPVADLEVVEMNFQGDDIDCWMEIQEGAGPTSREVSKIVSVGQPMTIVVAINDYNGVFDMRVKSCVAHDGVQQPISLTDEYGCVLRPKMLTPFTKIRNPSSDKKATVLSYSRFLAFKFPDSMTVQIQCTVEVCRHGCADACQRIPSMAATTLQPELSLSAKWPSSPNQPAIEGPKRNEYEPTRLSVYNSNSNRQQNNGFNEAPPPSDDMSGSDSNQLSNYVAVTPSQASAVAHHQQQPAQQPQIQNTQRRSQSSAPPTSFNFDSRIAQYLLPLSQQHGRRLSASARPITTTSIQPPPTTYDSAQQQAATTTTTTTTTTTSPPITMTTTSTSSSDNNRAQAGPAQEDSTETNQASSSANVNSNEESTSSTKLMGEQAANNDQSQSEQSQPSVQADPMDNMKAEASSVKLSLALPGVESTSTLSNNNEPPAADNNKQSESAENVTDNNKDQQPSVQASGDELSQENNKQESQASGSSLSSSLKPVEVEIPSSEEQVSGAFISNSPQLVSSNNNNQATFNSVRLSNNVAGNSNAQQDQYNVNSQITNKGYDNNDNSGEQAYQQIIQPRESQQQQQAAAKRQDKNNDDLSSSGMEAIAMMGSGKNRFGTRQSQAPLFNVDQQQPSIVVGGPAQIISAGAPQNHQMASSVDQAQLNNNNNFENKESLSIISSSSADSPSDKVLIDRSDDSSSLTDLTFTSSSAVDNHSSSSNSESPNKPSGELTSNDEQGSYLDSAASGGKINPVVGTEELASGPLQIEDRIGAPAPQESLEEALSRLQQQIPQSAALLSSSSSSSVSSNKHQVDGLQKSTEQVGNQSEKPDQRTDMTASASPSSSSTSSQQQQSSAAVSLPDSSTKQQSELKSDVVANDRFDMSKKINQDQQQLLRHSQQQFQKATEANQPYPNVVGQAKVMPDPTNSVNTRGPLVAQTSNEAAVSVLPAVQLQQQQQGNPIANIAQQQQQQQHQKSVAQITNIPIAVGFAQNSQIPTIQQLQQIAYYQQQQQQQQQAIKPIVQQQTTTTAKPRSRFTILSPQAALHAVASRFLPKSTPNAQTQQQTIPLAKHIPQLLSSIKLLPSDQQQQKQPNEQPQQNNFFIQQQNQLPQQYIQNRFPVNMQQPQQQQQSVAGGLFGRLSKQKPQQPLVRSRRSALLPNGKQQGTGEVGVTKTFMVVTNMDLAFAPNLTSQDELPEILQGRRLMVDEDGEVIYGVCMPIVSLTFVLTCAFWLIVFIVSFCIYLLMKSRKYKRENASDEIVKK